MIDDIECKRRGISPLNKDGNITYVCGFYNPKEHKYTEQKYTNRFIEALDWIQNEEFKFYSQEDNTVYLPKGISIDRKYKGFVFQIPNPKDNGGGYIAIFRNKDLEKVIECRKNLLQNLLNLQD